MQHYHTYVNLRTGDVAVNGVLVYSDVRYTITVQGREYLARLRVEEDARDLTNNVQTTAGVRILDVP